MQKHDKPCGEPWSLNATFVTMDGLYPGNIAFDNLCVQNSEFPIGNFCSMPPVFCLCQFNCRLSESLTLSKSVLHTITTAMALQPCPCSCLGKVMCYTQWTQQSA